jgi:hypothetical protein
MSDQIEVGAVLTDQAERGPAHPNDEIGCVGTSLTEAVQARCAGETTIADAYLARHRRAAIDRLATVPVGQFQMGKAAASEIVDTMQSPTGGFGARLVEATAIAEAQGASGPAHGGTGRLVRHLSGDHGVEELDRLVEPIFHGWIAHFRKPEHGGPGGSLAQRQTAGAARQRETQQVHSGVDFAFPLDRPGLLGQGVEIEIGGKPTKQCVEPVRRQRCRVLHLPPESYRFASRQALF